MQKNYYISLFDWKFKLQLVMLKIWLLLVKFLQTIVLLFAR
jgi:hypothetical protein